MTNGTEQFVYTHLANTQQVLDTASKHSGVTLMNFARKYDALNRLTSAASTPSSGPVLGQWFQYDAANQRTRSTLADGSYWVYQYDALGQVKSGKRYWSDGTPVAGQQHEYTFDDIGNRKTAASGGNEWGTNLRYENYTANDLNQYTLRTVPGYVDVLGAAATNAEVTVWSADGPTSTYRKGEYFRGEKRADNVAEPVWFGLTNIGVLRGATTNVADFVTTNSGFVLVPPRQQTFLHDADGNLTNDSVWSCVWDGENRLVGMDGLATLPAAARQSLRFTYDSQGRRISKVVSNWTGSAWSKLSEQRFVYDGWNLLTILDSGSSVIQSLMWGLDLSGTAQGAGGVGGLLVIGDSTNGVHFTCYDDNGNITALVSATNGTETARYEYSPFGRVLRASGSMAKANVVRFSTKFQDAESDLLYYGFRSYNPNTGRWLSRDPYSETAGGNLYCFGRNGPLVGVDPDGRVWMAPEEQLVLNVLSHFLTGCGDPLVLDDSASVSAIKGVPMVANTLLAVKRNAARMACRAFRDNLQTSGAYESEDTVLINDGPYGLYDFIFNQSHMSSRTRWQAQSECGVCLTDMRFWVWDEIYLKDYLRFGSDWNPKVGDTFVLILLMMIQAAEQIVTGQASPTKPIPPMYPINPVPTMEFVVFIPWNEPDECFDCPMLLGEQ